MFKTSQSEHSSTVICIYLPDVKNYFGLNRNQSYVFCLNIFYALNFEELWFL